jgi:hypothetical protein
MINFIDTNNFYKIFFSYQKDMFITFAMFYMIIFGNFIKGIFTCRQIYFFENNKYFIYFVSFLLFYFLCSLLSNTGILKSEPPIQKLLYTIIYFLFFLLTIRLDLKITFIVLAIIFLIYFINLNKIFYLENKNSQNNLNEESSDYWITLVFPFKVKLIPIKKNHFDIIDKIEYILFFCLYILIFLGLLAYGGEIKDTLTRKKEVTWVDVFLDTKLCHVKERRPFTHYLKLGLGLKL